MSIKDKALHQALQTLRALKAEFVVRTEGGELHKHGEIEIAEKKSKKYAAREFPRGTYTELVKSQGITGMKVGDVLTLNSDGKRKESVRSTAINMATSMWGANSVTTSVNGNKVEVLRIV